MRILLNNYRFTYFQLFFNYLISYFIYILIGLYNYKYVIIIQLCKCVYVPNNLTAVIPLQIRSAQHVFIFHSTLSAV